MSKVKYYKVTNESECHHGFQYVDGLNTDTRPFVKTGNVFNHRDWKDSILYGLYFTDLENIQQFFGFGSAGGRHAFYVREVSLPLTEKAVKNISYNPRVPNRPFTTIYRAKSIILGKRWTVSDFIKEHIDFMDITNPNIFSEEWLDDHIVIAPRAFISWEERRYFQKNVPKSTFITEYREKHNITGPIIKVDDRNIKWG